MSLYLVFNFLLIIYIFKTIPLIKGKIGSCSCDFTSNSCDDFCCCDNNCPKEAINYWKNHKKCIDEKNNAALITDRCIDSNLVLFSNKRRGLKKEEKTEDIAGKEGVTLTNYCFSIDNSKKMKKELKKLSDLKSLGYDYNPSRIFEDYFEGKLLKSIIKNKKNDEEKNNEIDNNLLLSINVSDKYFNKEGNFSLSAGDYCYASKKVTKFHSESYSCIMSTDFLLEKKFFIDGVKCEVDQYYYVNSDGLLNCKKSTVSDDWEGKKILEMEFVIEINPPLNTSKYINKCSINIVYTEHIAPGNNEYMFKNSVKFVNEDNSLLPYKFSGNNGYLEGYPLKLVLELDSKKIAFSEFIIPGKNLDGLCREYSGDETITNYLYGKDKSLLFGEDFIYTCKLKLIKVTDTVLYNIIEKIKGVGKFGSSLYKNFNKEEEWVKIVGGNQTLKDNSDFIININIYIESKGSETNPQKSIYKVTKNLSSEETEKENLVLNIKYYYLNLDGEIINPYDEVPFFPTIIPKIPKDLVDPIIQTFVDK